jgi:hypothetical protein
LFFVKINKIDKSPVNLTISSKENNQINKTRNKKEEIIRKAKEIQGIIRDYFENLYSIKLENLEKMDKFVHTFDYPKLNQEDITHLNMSITCNEIEETVQEVQT